MTCIVAATVSFLYSNKLTYASLVVQDINAANRYRVGLRLALTLCREMNEQIEIHVLIEVPQGRVSTLLLGDTKGQGHTHRTGCHVNVFAYERLKVKGINIDDIILRFSSFLQYIANTMVVIETNHRHAAEARKSLAYLKELSASLDGWELTTEKEGVKLYSRAAKDSAIAIVRGDTEIKKTDLTPRQVASVATQPGCRKICKQCTSLLNKQTC